MKLSVKLRDDPRHQTPLIKAKLPITILTLPFISTFNAGDSSDLSFNLTTNFSSCPSLRFSYSPNSIAENEPPFKVSLKSGVGLFGSPKESPLVISADLNLFCDKNPSFMLQVKPRFGPFSVHKTACSMDKKLGNSDNSNSAVESDFVGWSNIDIESGVCGGGKFVRGAMNWRDLQMDSFGEKGGILSGFKVRARSELPIGSKMLVNFRWGMNFPADMRKGLPFLTMDKIGIQRMEEMKEDKKVVEKVENGVGQVEKMNGMYSWLRTDLEELRRENRGLRRSLEEIKVNSGVRKYSSEFEERNKSFPKLAAGQVSCAGFSDTRSKRNGADKSLHKDVKKSINKDGSLEDELQKAIKAASAP